MHPIDPIIEDIENVGPNKAIGYLPYFFIESTGIPLETLIDNAREKGLVAKFYKPEECSVYSGALYVYDREALQILLNNNTETLEHSGWPKEAQDFFEYHVTNHAEGKTPLFDLIADCYADYENPGRINVTR